MKKRPKWLQSISHNFNDLELDEIEKSAAIDSSKNIIIKGLIINPGILGSPIIIPKELKKYMKN